MKMSDSEMVEAAEFGAAGGPGHVTGCVRWGGGDVGDWHPTLRHLRVIRLLGPA